MVRKICWTCFEARFININLNIALHWKKVKYDEEERGRDITELDQSP